MGNAVLEGAILGGVTGGVIAGLVRDFAPAGYEVPSMTEGFVLGAAGGGCAMALTEGLVTDESDKDEL